MYFKLYPINVMLAPINIIALNASLNTDMEKGKAVAPEAEKTKARG